MLCGWEKLENVEKNCEKLSCNGSTVMQGTKVKITLSSADLLHGTENWPLIIWARSKKCKIGKKLRLWIFDLIRKVHSSKSIVIGRLLHGTKNWPLIIWARAKTAISTNFLPAWALVHSTSCVEHDTILRTHSSVIFAESRSNMKMVWTLHIAPVQNAPH